MIKYIDKIIKKIALNKYNGIISLTKDKKEFFKILTNEELKDSLLKLKKDNFSEYSEALAIISILSERFIGLMPFDVQLKGALILNDGYIAEMKTGEGKTLSTIISLIINYLSNKSAHIVTANEYLVKRDYELSKPLFDFLDITSGYINQNQSIQEKQHLYNLDIVYSTSKGLVFDYLNNNKFLSRDNLFNQKNDFVIVDEIDFVLIDEARTPIILSEVLDSDIESFKILQVLQKDFVGAYKNRENEPEDPDFFYTNDLIELTEKGYNLLEKKLIEKEIIKNNESLYEGDGFKFIKGIERALRANYIFKKDIHYLIIKKEVVMINWQTGRPQLGSRYSDGLHQALEAKEGVEINRSADPVAQTTLQNYFKKYKKLSGITGTAITEEVEFKEFYFTKVLPVETNKPLLRVDSEDLLFLNKEAMKKSLLIDLKENLKIGRPTLIGVRSVADSDDISNFLTKNGFKFEKLDAKNNEKEASIIAKAGEKGSITIATNMAGRGTDIMLGGNKEFFIKELIEKENITYKQALESWNENNKAVVEAGGLSVIGIGRSESRRLDNQLIGRSGRQGDPGFSKFYLTLGDDLFANVNTSFLKRQWKKGGENESISVSMISKIIRDSQRTKENDHFNIRKNLLKFDNINTEQREIFYDWRFNVIHSDNLNKVIENFFKDVILNVIYINTTMDDFLSNNLESMNNDFRKYIGLDISIKDVCEKENIFNPEDIAEFIFNKIIEVYRNKASLIDKDEMLLIEKDLLLRIMDKNWAENISGLEEMRVNTGLRSYAQKNPLDEYQKEALEMFSNLVLNVKRDYCLILMKFSPYALLEKKESREKLNFENNKEDNQNNVEINGLKLNSIFTPMLGVGI